MLNFNLNANSFYAYMRTLAAEHKDIGPDDANNDRKHFFIGELEDFFKGLKSVVLFPALVVEGFQLNLSDSEQSVKYRESAFMVVFDFIEQNSSPDVINCLSKSEDVGLEILRRMSEDGNEATCTIRIQDVKGIPVVNETDKYAGIRFSFTLLNGNDTEIDTDKWQQ